MSGESKHLSSTVANNRKARFEYTIEEELEAGLVLTGTEVKSLRAGRAQIQDAYASERDGELWLLNAHIEEYKGGNRQNHEPRRPRKLLLHAKQVRGLLGKLQRKGMTLVPLSLYFNTRGIAKLKLGLAMGKKQYEKRQTIKEREWGRHKGTLLKNK